MLVLCLVPLIAAILARSPLVGAQGVSLFINTPQTVVQCLPVQLNFGGTNPPFIITVHPGGHPEVPALVNLPQTSGTSLTWTPNLPPGSYTLMIRDSTGAQNPSAPFSIQPGSGGCGATSAAPPRTSTTPVPPTTSAVPPRTSATLAPPTTSITLTALTTVATSDTSFQGSLPTSIITSTTSSMSGIIITLRQPSTWPTYIIGTSSQTPSPSGSPSSSEIRSSKNVGALVGGILGGLAGLAILIALIWVSWRKKLRARPQVDPSEGGPGGGLGHWDESEKGKLEHPSPAVGSPSSPTPPYSSFHTPGIAPTRPTLDLYDRSSSKEFNPYGLFPTAPHNNATIVDQPPLSTGPPPPTKSTLPTLQATAAESEALPPVPQHESIPLSNVFHSAPRGTNVRLPSSPLSRGPLAQPSANTQNRLSAAQLQTIQSLMDRNIQGAALEAVINSMLAMGGPHEGAGSPAPPVYDFKNES